MGHLTHKANRIFLILLASSILSGCLSTANPLSPRDRAKKESPLIGCWHSVMPSATGKLHMKIWSVYYFGGDHFKAVMSDHKAYAKEDFDQIKPDDSTDLFKIYTSTLGNESFLSLKGIRGTDMKDFLIVKYELKDGFMNVWNISDAAIAKAAGVNQIRTRRLGGSYVVTSGSKALGKWVSSLSPSDYEEYATFERSDLDPLRLTHHLLSTIPSEE